MNYLESQFGYSGKSVIITGGAGMIARNLAAGFLQAGASVSLWSRNINELNKIKSQLIEEINCDSSQILCFSVDCGDRIALEKALEESVKTHGSPSVLVNGVGGNKGKCSFNEQDIDKFQDILYMNLIAGMILPTQVISRHWIKQSMKGSIINMTSMASYLAWSGVWAYDAAKAGVMNLTKGAAAEFATLGIRVNSISPGVFIGKQNHDLLIETDSPLSLTERGEKIISRTPMKRFGDYKELQGACLFLGHEEAAGFVTGIDIPVDGGFLVDLI